MAALESRRQRFPVCGRVAVVIALVPVLVAVLLAMLTPFLITDDCLHAGGLLVCQAGHGPRDDLLSLQDWLPTLAGISVSLGVLMYFACRRFALREGSPGQSDEPPSSGSK